MLDAPKKSVSGPVVFDWSKLGCAPWPIIKMFFWRGIPPFLYLKARRESCGLAQPARNHGFRPTSASRNLNQHHTTMANVNKVILIGNLTRDPEVKHTQKGLAVADFGLAVNRTYTTEAGEKREEATFIDITVWGKTAELARQYLTKGRQIYIEGRLQLDSWEDKQTGQKRSKLRVIGETIQFLDSRQEGQQPRSRTGGQVPSARSENAAPSPVAAASAPLDGDDYPF